MRLGRLTVRPASYRSSVWPGPLSEVVLSHELASALRELRLMDAHCERLVCRIRAHGEAAVLAAAYEDLDELARFGAAPPARPTLEARGASSPPYDERAERETKEYRHGSTRLWLVSQRSPSRTPTRALPIAHRG